MEETEREGDAGTPQFNRLPPVHLRELEALNWAAAALAASLGEHSLARWEEKAAWSSFLLP